MTMDLLLNKVDRNIEKVISGSGVFGGRIPARSWIKKGKKLRARLCIAFSERSDGKAVDMASSMELLHAATLIHDDILDHSSLRRGTATFHSDIGIPAGVLFGDYFFTEALRTISSFNDPVLVRETITSLSRVLKGEMMEQSERGNILLPEEKYHSIIEMKSGCLFGMASKAGALIRKKQKFKPDPAYKFGLNAGIAYQILDDYMDCFGPGDGKQRFNDIKEGVITLPVIKLMSKFPPDVHKTVISVLGRHDMDPGNMRDFMEHMKRYDIPLEVLDEAEIYLKKAKMSLKNSGYEGIHPVLDILSWIENKVDNARKEYSNSRRRICGAERAQAA